MSIKLLPLFLFVFFVVTPLLSQNIASAQPKEQQRFSIDVKDMDVRDVIRLISRGYDLNIVLDREVSGRVTLNLIEIPVDVGLSVLVEAYGWELTLAGDVYHIGIAEPEARAELTVTQGLVSADILNAQMSDFVQDLSEKAGVSIIAPNNITGLITAKLYNIPVRDAIKSIFEGNGFSVTSSRGVYTIGNGDGGSSSSQPRGNRRQFSVDLTGNELTIEVQNGDLNALIQQIAQESELEIVIYGQLTGQVNARLNRIPLDEGLALILGGTKYTFVNRGNIILIGDRNGATPAGQTLTTSKLIHLYNIKADGIPEVLPRNIPTTSVRVVKEQNALLISGTSEDIVKVEEFLRTIDIPTPQVALDVLIVEYTRGNDKDMGFEFSANQPDGAGTSNYYSFPKTEINRSGDQAKDLLTSVFGNKSFITNLPSDFMMTLRLLEEQKRAKVLAQPTLTVLNGHQASIDVGETSYYSVTGGTADSPTQNFRPINAGITVNITPWISRSGQITVDVNPEISNTTTVNSDGYPTISRRSINTTVRVNDENTVVLGGLLKSVERVTNEQVPILGDIPLLGYLFKTTKKEQVQTNLVVYITPRIIDGIDFVDLPAELRRLSEENSRIWLRDLEESIVENYNTITDTVAESVSQGIEFDLQSESTTKEVSNGFETILEDE